MATNPGGLAEIVRRNSADPSNIPRLIDACLARVNSQEARLHALVHVNAKGAMARAKELAQELVDGRAHRPLHGVPIVVKEIFSVDGMPFSTGSRLSLPDPADGEGMLVRTLRDAGCVILGKSVSTEFAFAQHNIDKEMPVNPRDTAVDRATGGSSSGSAAAQAAGYCGFALGTDTGGSVRAPAALCGVAGFKPSPGRWSMDGVFELMPGLDAPGVFANTLADIEVVYRGLEDAPAAKVPALTGMRLGIPNHLFFDELDRDVQATMEHVLDHLRAAGVTFVPLEFPDLREVDSFFRHTLTATLRDRLGGRLVEEHWSDLDSITRQRFAELDTAKGDGVTLDLLSNLREQAERILDEAGVQAWVAPTVPCVAPPQSELRDPQKLAAWQGYVSRNTRCVNALRMTACSIPVQPASVLPVGLQIAGQQGGDALVLGVGRSIEAALQC